jgi:predicted nucleic acid-binding protein
VILLDTSVLSLSFRRRQPGPQEVRVRQVLEGLLEGDTPLAIPGIVLQEVLSGVKSDEQFTKLEQRLRSSFTVLLPTEETHVAAARLLNTCLAHGISASGPDCLIAVQAMAGGHELFTVDDDFTGIARHSSLKLYKWESAG